MRSITIERSCSKIIIELDKILLFLRKRVGLLIILALFWSLLILLLNQCKFDASGNIIYLLDDTYIHLSMAKNFSINFIWGIDSTNFTSTSSSILYTLLLSSLFFVFGVNSIVPLILNIIFANILIVLVYFLLLSEHISKFKVLISLISIILFTPLPTLILIGMEHILFGIVVVICLYLSSTILSRDYLNEHKKIGNKEKFLLTFIPFLTFTRFEGLFLLLVISILFLVRKKFSLSLLIGVLGILPIVIYGFISISNGYSFFPNSILLKGNVTVINNFNDLSAYAISIIINLLKKLLNYYLLLFLLGSIALIFIHSQITKKYFWNKISISCIIFIAVSILQLSFASAATTLNLFRYDSYLIIMAIYIIALFTKHLPLPRISYDSSKEFYKTFSEYFTSKKNLLLIFCIGCILLSTIPLCYRFYYITVDTPLGSKNIHDQQYQMSLFLQNYYQGESIAANDIGFINYNAEIECVDLYGLADQDIASAKLNGSYTTELIDRICREKNVKIAILYSSWFKGNYSLPESWFRAGSWSITNNRVCGDSKVDFYVVDPNEKSNLISHLKEFSYDLPVDVIESGYYYET